jgi:CheY-like chemotaxis protein
MRFILEDAGYEVCEAPDGKPALAQLAASPQGMVVLLDLQMPGMDGVAVLYALTKNEQLAGRHAFILVTAQSHQDEHGQQILRPDVARLLIRLSIPVLFKPFDIDELVETVREAEHWLTPLPRERALDA